MREMYNKDNPKMLNSAVCFIDILGFSKMVDNSCKCQNGNQLLSRLCHSIKENASFINPPTQYSGTIKFFTDNIVIGVPINDDGESELGQIFLGFASYQLSLTLEGFFIRGGISIGDYYADEFMSYGSALLEAHHIESNISNNPRIVLSENARQMVSKHLEYYANPMYAPQVSDVFADVDGEWFINYLEAAFITRDEEGYDFAYKIMIMHRDMIMTKLNEFYSDPKVLSKYEWVARYHNHFCKLNFNNSVELLITKVDNSGTIGFIA